MSTIHRPARILPIIVISQLMGTSLWFSGNAILDQLQARFHLGPEAAGTLTSSVQLGFIAGTLLFAFLMLADRHSPRHVFLICSVGGALSNLGIYFSDNYSTLLLYRCLTGVFLAGIYPVGMKIAAGWHDHDLGKALGYLVGALVVGTALPHLVQALGQHWAWSTVIFTVSAIAVLGGVLMWAGVPDGPHLKRNPRFHAGAFRQIFQSRKFRASAFGYFGHMWELYAFWAFVPLFLRQAAPDHPGLNISFWTFCIIAVGSVGSVAGGLASFRMGSAQVAAIQLSFSGLCCLLSPLFFFAPLPVLLAFLIFWGIVVVGDSPQFSTLNAQYAPKELVGSALTLANCLGFAITIGSIQLLSGLTVWVAPPYWLIPLALGPLAGLAAMRPLRPTE
ncbi:MAG: MFS transporter [Nitrospinaceae bacterium]|nr:MFS transporter [Nitrospinaceae bacterium]NIR53990.1 MFS transporter [Nitrospinaceae bacterium]NIS84409.1 MFS transporter [Nitrospinaceae bacterium]NIT81200.1 MFS transporter [Nitrospinaceae bacterium]NIU43489.1 MFS transporter [Nitrospinaceae bacterium]